MGVLRLANPKGNPGNLIQNQPSTPDQRRKNAQKARAARTAKEAVRVTLRDALLRRLAEDGNQEAIIDAAIEQAREGNLKAFEIIRDTIGEKPKDKVEQSGENTVRIVLEGDVKELAQ